MDESYIPESSEEDTEETCKALASLLNLRDPEKKWHNGKSESTSNGLGMHKRSISMLELNEMHSIQDFAATVETSLHSNTSTPTEVNSWPDEDDDFFFGDIEEPLGEDISPPSDSMLGGNFGQSRSQVTLGTHKMTPLKAKNTEAIEPKGLSMRKSTSMFSMHDSMIHPIDEECEKVNWMDETKEDDNHADDNMSLVSSRSSLHSVQEDSKVPLMKKSTSFLKFVDADPDIVHKHCKTLKPKKSSMKKSTSTSSFNSGSANDDSREASSKSMRRKASFSTLEVRTYNVAIGDNPGSTGSSGAPVSLCWEYDCGNIQLHDLNTYEELRPKRRNMNQLYLSPYVREWMLLRDNGYTACELKQAAKEADKARKFRRNTATVNSIAPIPVQQALRGFRKKSRRLLKV
eukprot:CAMPEP_0197833526 /NCGR_PEP_ID=MMETSP1437-20131217/19358_1 /TAXON_ID=49252 ORGANISM="Eucampia antarctica, Strain CCMP1452" /NCGR_SAMPLE_ID=MMETSP1437 /ASSEMBLY_ACC=CAM_ASM_001096 /LENGTH=402 /DNA_ID=CAMNT_0043437637 /DNA_START=26 /DNA_END=1234 /DNA_ORIENTATION=+